MTALRSEIEQSGKEIRRTLDVAKIAARGIYKSQLPIMAAALAYRTLFSIIPLLVVGLVIFGSRLDDAQVEEGVNKLLQFAGLDEIVVREEPPGDGGGAVAQQDDQEQPVSIEAWIQTLVERVRHIPLRAMGVAGGAFLIYAALAMFMEVERAFNRIYRVHKNRNWFTKFTTYWTVVTLGAIFLLATFYVGDKFTSLVAQISGDSGIGAGGVLVTIAGFIVTVCISTLLFVSMYTIVPNTRVSVRAALAGGIFAAILWEASKWGFTEYLRYSAGYSRMYGSVALLPLFMLWIYVTWMVVLFGLQISYTMQRWSDWRTSPTIDSDEPVVIDAMAGLSIALETARAFADGKQLTWAELAKRCELHEAIIAHLIDPMIEGGVLNHIATDEDGPDTVALARPADQIRVAELITLVQNRAATPGGEVGVLIARVRDGAAAAAGDQTLADLLVAPAAESR